MSRTTGGRLRAVGIPVACFLVLGGGVFLLARHRPARPSPASTPSPPIAHTPTSAATPTPTVAASPSHPHGSPTPAAQPSRTPSPTPSPSPTVAPGTLVNGPYGFPVPQGWTFRPLSATGPTSQAANWVDPAGGGRIDYLVDTTTAIYTPDHLANLPAIEGALPCRHLPPITFAPVPNRGPHYTCAPQDGFNVTGQVLILPYPQGLRLVQVQMPPSKDTVAAQILTAFH